MQIDQNISNEEDTLLESLLFLSKFHKRTASAESLIAGLAIHNTLMTPAMFIKSAKKIGLIVKAVNRKLHEIDNLALPAVMLLNNNKACVVLNIDSANNKVKLIMPHVSQGELNLSIEEVEKLYTGNLFIVKPAYNFENRVDKDVEVTDTKKWFWRTMKKNLGIYKLVIIAAVLINIFVIFVPLFTMNVYDRVLPNKAIDTLWVLLSGIVFVLIFDFILKLIRAYFIEQAGKRADIRMSSKIFDQLLNIKLDSKPASTGMFVSRLQSFESVREFFTTATITAFVDLPFVILFIFIIFYVGGPIGYISVATMLIAILFSFFMQRPIKKNILNSAKEDQIKQTVLTETVTGLEIIKSVRAQNRMRTHWEKSISQTSYYGNKTHYLSQIVTYFVGLISQLSGVLIVAGGVLLASEGSMTMGAIIAAMMLNSRVIGPVSQIAGMIIRLDRTMLSLNNIDEIMKMPVERQTNQNYLSRPQLNGDIIYKDVNFAYKDQKFDVLKDINLKIKKGEKIGIIGKIGSGKSTLAKLLLNLYEPSKGSVLVDNTDIRQIDPVDLRRSIGYVPQEPFLFMGSIKDNITIGEQYATDEQILKASKVSGVHDFLGKHESGYDLIVGERGEGLSGGERQSVTLARAILSNPNILVLDEPTNMMDELSENSFKQKLSTIIEDKTVIIVTHKPSLLSLVDRLIVVEDGKIVADGPKDNIVASFGNKATRVKRVPNA
ncbi:type I secretion system permease/ATPase [Poseidonibacter parvus]|uniref:Type I secretion system permease/ATPase n=1 Tax=Poseidonibacter parvus TaxID=1850254 RepID=A0A1P8KNT4_9BACT|nr:type I secretion system permease/ATPase [Poseidonibacter parvus]APW66210.1 type I secretion system permease/ATPase [Poseidonibacter parvus]